MGSNSVRDVTQFGLSASGLDDVLLDRLTSTLPDLLTVLFLTIFYSTASAGQDGSYDKRTSYDVITNDKKNNNCGASLEAWLNNTCQCYSLL